jgi:hypothetical protein
MTKYFDHTFFKMFFGFVTILSLSFLAVLFMRVYSLDDSNPKNTANVIDSND